jgi:hypothetical protein
MFLQWAVLSVGSKSSSVAKWQTLLIDVSKGHLVPSKVELSENLSGGEVDIMV